MQKNLAKLEIRMSNFAILKICMNDLARLILAHEENYSFDVFFILKNSFFSNLQYYKSTCKLDWNRNSQVSDRRKTLWALKRVKLFVFFLFLSFIRYHKSHPTLTKNTVAAKMFEVLFFSFFIFLSLRQIGIYLD